jgi:glycosyltransferase involved in cell wall biosynthesis
MNIAYLSTFYPYRGGIAQFNAKLFREFEKKHNIKAWTFKRQYPDMLFPGSSQFVSDKDSADKIDAVRVLDTINPITYWTTAAKIKKMKPDIMLTKFWMPFFGSSLGQVARILKNKGVTNISILDNVKPHEKRPGDDWLINFFLRHNHGFITMSEQVRDDLLEYKPDAKFKLVQHPLYDQFPKRIDRETACDKLNIDPSRKVILFFGFIRKYKGLDVLLEAMETLPDDYVLLIAGESYGSFNEYMELIKRKNLYAKVKMFVRYIEDSEVTNFFSAADVCVLPYKSATQSGIVGISYYYGLPIIATDVGGLKEMIIPYGTGMMVDKPAQHLLSAAIADYFNMQLRDIYEKRIEDYKKIANWEVLADTISEFYEELKQD